MALELSMFLGTVGKDLPNLDRVGSALFCSCVYETIPRSADETLMELLWV